MLKIQFDDSMTQVKNPKLEIENYLQRPKSDSRATLSSDPCVKERHERSMF